MRLVNWCPVQLYSCVMRVETLVGMLDPSKCVIWPLFGKQVSIDFKKSKPRWDGEYVVLEGDASNGEKMIAAYKMEGRGINGTISRIIERMIKGEWAPICKVQIGAYELKFFENLSGNYGLCNEGRSLAFRDLLSEYYAVNYDSPNARLARKIASLFPHDFYEF